MAMLLEVPVGQRVKVTLTARDSDDQLADASSLVATVTHPDGTEDSHAQAAMTHEGTGLYSFTFTPDAHGRWFVHAADDVLEIASDYDFVLAQ